ncbi:MAG: DNA internalization-related competence protein ComEC/Rec2 [Candidatus Sumerlaeia bacterium]
MAPPSRPVVLVALSHLAGLAVGLELGPPLWPLFAVIVFCLAASSVNWWRSRRIDGPALARGRLLLLAFAAFGAWQGSGLSRNDAASLAAIEPWLHEPALTVTGVVAEPPRIGPDWAEIVVADVVLASREKPAARMRLNIALRLNESAAAELAKNPGALPLPGRRVQAEGWLAPIAGAANPSTFDSPRYWLSRGIGARMNINRQAQVQVGPPPSGLRGRLEMPMKKLRLAIARTFDARLSPGASRLARALVLGQAELISDDARDAFRLAGWAHLLAVSGQNAGIVLLIVFALARLAFVPPRPAAWLAIAGIAFYMALTSFLPPVTRAGIMAIFILAGYAMGRVATGPASLAAAALFTLIFDPRSLTRLDWQLSYVCVLSMILLAPPIYEWATSRNDSEPPTFMRLLFNRYVILPVVVSFAIQIGLLPLQVAYFRQLNVLIVFSNIFGILAASVATGLAMFLAALGWIPGLGAVLGYFTNHMLLLLGWLAGSFADVPGTVLTLPVLAPALAALFYGALLTGRWLMSGEADGGRLDQAQRRSLVRHVAAAVAILGFGLLWLPLLHSAPNDTLDLYMLDVGQGDCFVLRSAGRTMVIDAGPPDRGRLNIEPFLRTLNIDRIDCLVATHADADHVGGMAELVDHFKVGRFIQGNDVSDSECYATLVKEIARGRVPTVAARAGSAIDGFGRVKIRMLGPVPGFTDNNGSVVLLVELGRIQMLLMGDLEQAGEEKLLSAGAIPDVEVLKVGHHGSRSSTGEELLNDSRPELALVSVGANNRFGHPSAEVIDRLDDAGAQILRTDRLGAIWLHTDGNKIEVYRYK